MVGVMGLADDVHLDPKWRLSLLIDLRAWLMVF